MCFVWAKEDQLNHALLSIITKAIQIVDALIASFSCHAKPIFVRMLSLYDTCHLKCKMSCHIDKPHNKLNCANKIRFCIWFYSQHRPAAEMQIYTRDTGYPLGQLSIQRIIVVVKNTEIQKRCSNLPCYQRKKIIIIGVALKRVFS